MLDFYSGSSSAVNTKSAMRECLDNAFGEGGGADCMARGQRMFNRVLKNEIIAKMQYPLSGEGDIVPWLGLYGYSEFCRFGGKNQFHSYTSALCPIVRREAGS
jgi:hypothetical protein